MPPENHVSDDTIIYIGLWIWNVQINAAFNYRSLFQNLLEFSLIIYYFSKCITAPVGTFNNFGKSEQIQTKFRSIIQNHSPVKITAISTSFLQPCGKEAH